MSAENDVWQVMVAGVLYETDLETLKQWVGEGAVQPTDKVNRGNRRWIDAGLAPALRATFYGGPTDTLHELPQQPLPSEPSAWAAQAAPPAQPAFTAPQSYVASSSSSNAQWSQPTGYVQEAPPNAYDVYETPAEASQDYAMAAQHYAAEASSVPAIGNVCYNHPQAPPKFICRVCCATLCAECPKFIGTGKIAMCPLCGDLCKPYEEFKQRTVSRNYQTAGFGFADFGRALQYPFKHIVALMFGAVFYAFLLLAGWRGQIIGCAILFGCISHTINQVATGKLDRSFLPEFGFFNFYEDVIRPFFLSISIIVVTWGPALVLFLAILFGWLGSSGSDSKTLMEKQREEQSQKLREDLSTINDDTADAQKQQQAMENLDPRMRQFRDPNATPTPQQNKAATKEDDSLFGLIKFAGLSITIVLLGLVAIGWAFFYYPMALAVAGYTEDVKAVVNPLVGLDTIKRMGTIYWKAFAMYAVVQLAGLIIGTITNLILSPFDMPFVGNLPATFVNGTVTFYTSLVIAFILGLALFKRADELDIPTD
jgi:hypothetical protein